VIKARFLPAAEAEFLKEVTYYSLAREGAGVRFQAAVSEAVAKAATSPSMGSPSAMGLLHRRVKGFPFDVVYRATDQELLVVAVAHHRRKPVYWSSRVT